MLKEEVTGMRKTCQGFHIRLLHLLKEADYQKTRLLSRNLNEVFNENHFLLDLLSVQKGSRVYIWVP